MVARFETKLPIDEKFESAFMNDFLSTCISKLRRARTKALVIFEESSGRYRGMVSERAIARSMLDPLRSKVRSVVQQTPALSIGSDIEEAARVMVENGLTVVPVTSRGKVVGVVEESAVLRQALQGDYGRLKVRDVMSREIISVSEAEGIGRAISLMRQNAVTRLPVVNGAKVTGVVTVHDIVEKVMKPKLRMDRSGSARERERFLRDPVRLIMSSPAVTLQPEARLVEALKLMESRGISSVLAVNSLGELEGIVTKHDLLRPLSEPRRKNGDMSVQLSAKIQGGAGEVDVKRLQVYLDSFVRRYSRVLRGSSLSVYVKAHRERKKGRRLIHVRMTLSGAAGSYSSVAEGWGDIQALRLALEGIERQVSRKKVEFQKNRLGHKSIYEALAFYY
jgi:CBS domain-containing protein